MKNYSDITESLDITTKQYVDSGFMPKTGGIFTGDVTITPGHLKTDLIKSADNSKWIAEFTAAGLEIGGSGTPLRFYSSTRPVVANQNKELAYTSDIPDISGKQDIITESNKLSVSLVSGLAQVATTGDYNDLLNQPTIPTIDTNNLAKLDTANTFTQGQTINGAVQVNGTVKGDWLQSGILGHVSSSTGKVCVFNATGTIYYRTPSEILSDAGGATLDELMAHINTVATQTTLGHIKMYVEGDTLYLNT